MKYMYANRFLVYRVGRSTTMTIMIVIRSSREVQTHSWDTIVSVLNIKETFYRTISLKSVKVPCKKTFYAYIAFV